MGTTGPDPVTVLRLPLTGSDAVGQVLAAVNRADPELGALLHGDTGRRPYATHRVAPHLEVVSFSDRLTAALCAERLQRVEVVNRIGVGEIAETPDGGARMTVRFVTPCHFRAAHRDYLFPAPERLFADALAKWRDLGWPERDDPNLNRVAGRIVAYREEPFRAKGEQRGFVGEVVFDLTGSSPRDRQTLWALARFAALRGVGAHTTYGMGRVAVG